MAKRKRAKRIMPLDGRLQNGGYQPEYSIGCEVGEKGRTNPSLLPKCTSLPRPAEYIAHNYVCDPAPAQVVIVDKDDNWLVGREGRKVVIRPKVLYARSRYAGQYVEQYEKRKASRTYLGRGKAFQNGISAALGKVNPEVKGAQMTALIHATTAECERRGVDWRRYIKVNRDWVELARILNDIA